MAAIKPYRDIKYDESEN